MVKIGVNTDNWRHSDKSVDYCLEAIAKQGIEYCEFEAVGGTEFFTGLGFAPFVPLDSDPLQLRKKLDKHNLKVSQLDVSFPINRWHCIDLPEQQLGKWNVGNHPLPLFQYSDLHSYLVLTQ